MPTTQELESQLQTQSADYLKRLEEGGQLPTIVSNAWNKAGGADQTALRNNEADLLTKYVTSASDARNKYKDTWDPNVRESLVTRSMANDYKPIAGIRAELASRAEALGIATQGAVSMYNADTAKSGTALGFTQDAYSRALAAEQEQTRQKERSQDIQIAASKGSGGGLGSGGKINNTDVSTAQSLLGQNDVQDWQVEQYLKSNPRTKGKATTLDDAKKALGDKTLSASEFAKAAKAAMDYFGDKEAAMAAMKKAWIAGGYKQYGSYPLGW